MYHRHFYLHAIVFADWWTGRVTLLYPVRLILRTKNLLECGEVVSLS